MLPPAPALFSTITDCPMFSESFLATMRPAVSVPPPGAKPTVRVTGRVGAQACAAAWPAKASAAAAASARKAIFIGMLLLLVHQNIHFVMAVTFDFGSRDASHEWDVL